MMNTALKGEKKDFKILMPNDTPINLAEEATFESIISQMQTFTKAILYVENGSICKYFKHYNDALKIINEKNYMYEYTIFRNNLEEYYFRNIYDDDLLCFFKKENVLNIFPNILPLNDMKKDYIEEYISVETIIEIIDIDDMGVEKICRITIPEIVYEVHNVID